MPEINQTNPIKPGTTQPNIYLPAEQDSSKAPVQETPSKLAPDTLSSTASAAPRETGSSSVTPKLTGPANESICTRDYFLALITALSSIKEQFSASRQVDLQKRYENSRELALRALEMSELVLERGRMLNEMNGRIDKDLDTIDKHTQKMSKQTKAQQAAINNLNKGNALEQQKNKELIDAYDKYTKDLESIGAVDKGNGVYEIPEGKEAEFNAITKEYQKSVDSYNQYWSDRQKEINNYNAGTRDYNNEVKDNNIISDDFTDEYELSDYLESIGQPPIGSQPEANIRDISGYPTKLDKPETIKTTPATVQTYPPPPTAYAIAKSGVQPVPSINSYTPIDTAVLREGMYQTQYDKFIAPFDVAMNSNVKYWSFTQNLEISEPEDTSQSLKDIRKLAKKLLAQDAERTDKALRRPLNAVSVDTPVVEKILAKSIIHRAINQVQAKLTEAQKSTITDQLLVLSIGLLSENSLNALFPSLSVIAPSLPSLPQDNPILPILFSVSLTNRIIETVQLGLTKETLTEFVKANPELSTLTEGEINQIAASMNVGLLLTAGKLLDTQLGFNGLMPQLLLPLLESQTNVDIKQLFQEVIEENKQDHATMTNELKAHYTEQGYPEETAQFLSDVGSRIVNEEISQTMAVLPSEQNIDIPLAVDTLKANLLLVNGPNYPISKAETTSKEAVEQTLAEGPYKTANQFYTSLEKQLNLTGTKSQSAEIARGVILAKKTSRLTPAADVKPPISTAQPVAKLLPKSIAAGFHPLPSKQLALQLTKHVEELATPFLGKIQARQMAEEVTQTLLGDLKPVSAPSAPLTEVKNEGLSFKQALEIQISTLKEQKNVDYTAVLAEDFKETIKTSISFYAFSLKLMDPLAAYTMVGIMYANRHSKGGSLII